MFSYCLFLINYISTKSACKHSNSHLNGTLPLYYSLGNNVKERVRNICIYRIRVLQKNRLAVHQLALSSFPMSDVRLLQCNAKDTVCFQVQFSSPLRSLGCRKLPLCS